MLRPRALLSAAKNLLPRPVELRHPARFLADHRFATRLLHEGYTGIAPRRSRSLLAAARRADRLGIEGAFVDCGVWNGGSTIMLGAAGPGRHVWAFDSFAGMPASGPEDDEESAQWTGKVVGSEKKLRDGFALYAGDLERLHVVPGWFEDTFPTVVDRIGPIAVLHIDADWYAPVTLALETFYPLVASGGTVLVDDLRRWEGARRATADFRERHGIRAPLVIAHYWTKR